MQRPRELIARFRSRVNVVDGALATELHARGHDISGPLWSGHVLLQNASAIEQVHMDYLRAGADVILTATYQITFQGLQQAGFQKTEVEDILDLSVALAIGARRRFLKEIGAQSGRQRKVGATGASTRTMARLPLVGASIGSYGAYLHDGSEYRGDFKLSVGELADFHRERFQVLARRADLIAFETCPTLEEAKAYRALLVEAPDVSAWIAFSCKDGKHTCHGERIADCARELNDTPNLVAIGVNCTAPRHVESLVTELRGTTDKPIVVYPNSGETWDSHRRCFIGESEAEQFGELAKRWIDAGANLVGGCCRTSPKHIAQIKAIATSPARGELA